MPVDALIIAGPTCSGKSALALALATEMHGTVVNADSMQVYRELRILTARPSVADEAAAPHALYGIRPAAQPGSAAWWRGAALETIADVKRSGRMPILCGGTGMYLSALTQGIAAIPDPGPDARAAARSMLAADGAPALHARLASVDPDTAATLRPSDGQRLARAWEVWQGTGRGMAAWHAAASSPPDLRFRMVLLDPPRPALRDAAAGRFAAMLAAGGLDEAAALLSLGLDPSLPLLRAHGVPELFAHLNGETTLDVATERAVLATGRYTKRQATWFRHRIVVAPCLTHTIHARFTSMAQFSESARCALMHFVKGLA